jgi:hypothetical protein
MNTPSNSDPTATSTAAFEGMFDDYKVGEPVNHQPKGRANDERTAYLPDSVAENFVKPHTDPIYTGLASSVAAASVNFGNYPVADSQPPIDAAEVAGAAHDLRQVGILGVANGVESLMVSESNGQVTRLPGIGGLLDLITEHGGVRETCLVNVVHDPGLLGADSSHVLSRPSLQSELFGIGSPARTKTTTERVVRGIESGVRGLAGRLAIRRLGKRAKL